MLVQRGKEQFTGLTATASLTTPVEVGKSFIVHTSTIFDTSSTKSVPCEAYLDTVVAGKYTEVKFKRGASLGRVDVSWEVVEDDALNVQSGLESGLTGTSKTVTISSVNTAKSFPIVSHSCNGADFGIGICLSANISSSTEIIFTKTSDSIELRWQVVEWDKVSVSKYTQTVSGTSANVAISSIDTSTSFIYGTQSPSSTDRSFLFTRYRFNSATEVQIQRGSSFGTIVSVFYVISMPGAKVFSLTNSSKTSDALAVEEDISSGGGLDMSKSFMMTHWHGNILGSDVRDTLLHIIKDSDTLRFEKYRTNSFDFNYFAVEIGDAPAQNTGNFLAFM